MNQLSRIPAAADRDPGSAICGPQVCGSWIAFFTRGHSGWRISPAAFNGLRLLLCQLLIHDLRETCEHRPPSPVRGWRRVTHSLPDLIQRLAFLHHRGNLVALPLNGGEAGL